MQPGHVPPAVITASIFTIQSNYLFLRVMIASIIYISSWIKLTYTLILKLYIAYSNMFMQERKNHYCFYQVKDIEKPAVWPPYQTFPRSSFFHSLLPPEERNASLITGDEIEDIFSSGSSSVDETPVEFIERTQPYPLFMERADLNGSEFAVIRIGDGFVCLHLHTVVVLWVIE